MPAHRSPDPRTDAPAAAAPAVDETGRTSAAITAPALRSLLARDPETRVLDVRTPGEFRGDHIPGAYNVPLSDLGDHVSELAGLHHTIVLVCQSGARASTAMERLAAAGRVDLRLLTGGMQAWHAAGGAVTVGEPRWSLERQVRLVAGSIVLGSVLASIAAPPARFVAGAVGGGLTFAALTDTCAMGSLLARLPYNRGPACDVDDVVAQLTAASTTR